MKKQEQHYEHAFKWAVYGICVAAFLFILGAVYAVTRVIDGNWTDWKLPVILGIIFLVVVPISAMFTSLSDIKTEIEKEIEKEKNKSKSRSANSRQD